MSELPDLRATLKAHDPEVSNVLRTGKIELLGRFQSSNVTLLGVARSADHRVPFVYKPEAGERPLWDFGPGLWRREFATYELSDALNAQIVPITIVREDLEFGIGSLQAFVQPGSPEHYFDLLDDGKHNDRLRAIAAFDVLANNADRKAGHLIVDHGDHVWGIDHGLCLHAENKLRTVIWDFAGEPIPGDFLDRIRVARESEFSTMKAHLSAQEADALIERADLLLRIRVLPTDLTGRAWPWPIV